jgi:lipid A 3-O-deacylase PagL
MNVTTRVFLLIALTIILTASATSQTPSQSGPSAMPDVVGPAPQCDDEPYTLRRGDNELGGWAGVSFKATTIFEGLHVSPLGFHLDFANGSKIHLFVHANDGFLAFTKEVPIEDSGQFAFTLEGGGGVRIFTSERRALMLGLRLHHISNGDRSGSNRGLNQFVFYGGFSVFK